MLLGAASTDPDGPAFGALGWTADAVWQALEAQASGALSAAPAALEAERASVRTEAEARSEAAAWMAATRAALWPAPHPYGHDPMGHLDVPSSALLRATAADLQRLDQRALRSAPRLCVLAGAVSSAGVAPPPPPSAPAPTPSAAQVVGGPRGPWRAWRVPPAAHPDADALRALGLMLQARGVPVRWWFGRQGGVFAVGRPARARPGRLLWSASAPGVGRAAVVARLALARARADADPAATAVRAALCWRSGRPLTCDAEGIEAMGVSDTTVRATTARWLPGLGAAP